MIFTENDITTFEKMHQHLQEINAETAKGNPLTELPYSTEQIVRYSIWCERKINVKVKELMQEYNLKN